jgi:hypothetical protein
MKRSLISQIAEVREEINMRRRVYPSQVAKGKMRQSEADYKIATMECIVRTLFVMQRHEDAIRKLVEAEEQSGDAA